MQFKLVLSNGITLLGGTSSIPRIGETIEVSGVSYVVSNVIWPFKQTQFIINNGFNEIVIEASLRTITK